MADATTDTPTAQRLDALERGLFFIVGCGRSGTTLLQSMLLSDERLVIPPETKFFAALETRGWRGRIDLSTDAGFEKAVALVWEDQARRGIRVDRDAFERFARAGQRSWEGLFLAVLAAFAEPSGATRVGEKSPVHTWHVGPLSDAFPHARFIHIVRDPRAVVLSRLRAGFGSRFLAPNVEWWRSAATMHKHHADRLGAARYLLVRYEDLVGDTEATLRRVCDFLGIEMTERMLEHHKRDQKGFPERSKAWMENTLKPVFSSSVEKWRSELSPTAVAVIERALAGDMRLMGYEPESTPAPPGARWTLSRVAGRLERLVQRGWRAALFVLRGFRRAPIPEEPETED